ncbi:MAG: Rid family hydrolase [Candidatus Omnitrophica bacterium]|nr:Rid family hydrolase [Candidatus Omnitrophota bacterium]
MIEKNSFHFADLNVLGSFSVFSGSSGVNEYHFTLFPTRYGSFSQQIECVERAYNKILKQVGIDEETCVFRRFFCSDLVNQYEKIKDYPIAVNSKNNCSISLISQTPYPYAKVALWAYHISDSQQLRFSSDKGLIRGKLVHFWDTNIVCTERETVYQQTECILSKYKKILEKRNMDFANNLIRTWFFIRNIDTNYKEFVEARKKIFKENGLVPETHFVASTGVEGEFSDIRAKVLLDAYSIKGIEMGQLKYIKAPKYICPTYTYGVTFERGVVVNYRDRDHIFISGTASINNKGEIVYYGEIEKQLEHTLKNIEILLSQAGRTFDDICIFIVYVRDNADAGFAYEEMRKRFMDTPVVVVCANVCRPGWLIEIECQSVAKASNDNLPFF